MTEYPQDPDAQLTLYEFAGCGDCGTPTSCAPARRCWRGRPDAWISFDSREAPHVPYTLTLNGEKQPYESLVEIRAEVAALVTDRLNAAPDRVALDAQTINMAFNSGAVEQAVEEQGAWFTLFDAHGENPVRIRITKGD